MPAFNDEYKLWADMPSRASGPDLGGTRQIGGMGVGTKGSMGGSYAYNPGWSSQDYIRENLKQDYSNPVQFVQGGGSIGQTYRAIAGRGKFSSARNGDRARQREFEQQSAAFAARRPTDYLNAYDPTSRTSRYAESRMSSGGAPATKEELQAVMDQEERDNLRGLATSKINDYFGDPSRQADYERLTQDQLKADTQNIGSTFDTAGTQAKLAAARQGLTGGSVEAENSATLGGQRSAALIDAAQGANKTFSNLTARDRAVQDQLLSLVNSDDPYQRQAAQAQLSGMQQQSATDAYQAAADQTRREAGQFSQNQMSQSIGGGLAGLTNLVRQDPNRGTSLSAWYTPARS